MSDDRYTSTDPIRLYDPAPWRTDAACAGTHVDLFFSDVGGNVTEAKAVCNTCTVTAECLQYAVDNHIRDGIFGGLSPRERRGHPVTLGVLTNRSSLTPARCGTPSGYNRHRNNGEPACDRCKIALYASRKARAEGDPNLTLINCDGAA